MDAGTQWAELRDAGPGPIDSAEPADSGCRASVRWVGVAIQVPFSTPEQVTFIDTIAGAVTSRPFRISNLTDEEFDTELSAEPSVFATAPSIHLAARESRDLAIFFAPTAVGAVSGSLEVRSGSTTLTTRLEGYGGGPNLVVADIDAGLIPFVPSSPGDLGRPDARPLTVLNRALPEEGARGTWRPSGELVAGSCSPFLSIPDIPQEVPPATEVTLTMVLQIPQTFSEICEVQLAGNVTSPLFRVSWQSEAGLRCNLSFASPSIELDAGSGAFILRNGFPDACYLSWPRIEPGDAGVVDAAWWVYWLMPGEELVVPVRGEVGASFVVNLGGFPGLLSVPLVSN